MSTHPYGELDGTPVWNALDRGISDLVANQDIEELTDRRYIVGYLAECLSEAGLVRDDPS